MWARAACTFIAKQMGARLTIWYCFSCVWGLSTPISLLLLLVLLSLSCLEESSENVSLLSNYKEQQGGRSAQLAFPKHGIIEFRSLCLCAGEEVAVSTLQMLR